jgi:large subunit ribosomal protein L16
MFNPIKLKFKKEHKSTFKNKEYSQKNSSLLFGNCGLVSKRKGHLFYKEIMAAKKAILKGIKGIGIVLSRVSPNRPRTKKKAGMRMGKGKSAVSNWVVEIKAGTVLFEVFGLVPKKEIKVLFKNSALRVSVPTKMVFKPFN